MNDFLLKVKNWQLFLIILIAPLILSTLVSIGINNYSYKLFMGLYASAYSFIFILWNYQVVTRLSKKKPALTPKQIKWSKILLLSIPFYIIITYKPISQLLDNYLVFTLLSTLIVFVSVFAIFYLMFCASRTIKYLQFGNDIRMSDIIVEMLSILYFIFGVWWFQKRVYEYYKNE